ncbi:hypothetical protein BC936DRAFT_140302 [Jimgerdemannia flammicorona]|uniref:Uncharacterized protein n=1 Tax=Jimgerdemannia flammicorona TaxID=994334 RepID=A0A433AVH7_9FUNG|nr:hypothetical protein BC936DRAFT_140302 [Jimgerdemannia flammicorona]
MERCVQLLSKTLDQSYFSTNVVVVAQICKFSTAPPCSVRDAIRSHGPRTLPAPVERRGDGGGYGLLGGGGGFGGRREGGVDTGAAIDILGEEKVRVVVGGRVLWRRDGVRGGGGGSGGGGGGGWVEWSGGKGRAVGGATC